MTASGLPATTSRRGLAWGLALGLPVVGYGLRGVAIDAARTHPPEMARWVVGAAVLNDLVLIPAAMALGWTARRLVPSRAWPAVRGGLLATGALALVAWPFVRGYGRDPANPSLLPRNYDAGLVAALTVVWAVVAAVLVVAEIRARGRWRGQCR